jgi:hypothetical protein
MTGKVVSRFFAPWNLGNLGRVENLVIVNGLVYF